MIGIIIITVLGVVSIWLLVVGLNEEELKEKNENKELEEYEEYKRKKLAIARAKLFAIYAEYGRSWFARNKDPLLLDEWIRKEPVYSEDGIILGYNFYITEEGIQMLKKYRGS